MKNYRNLMKTIIALMFLFLSTSVLSQTDHPFTTYLDHSKNIDNSINGTALDNGLTGSWYNPDQSGHGFMLEVLPNNRMLLAWYAYDSIGDPIFIVGVGELINPNAARFNMSFSTGMIWGVFDPTNIVRNDWGTIDMTYNGCNSATIDYDSTYTDRFGTVYGSGSIPVIKLTNISNLPCAFIPQNFSGISGSVKDAITNSPIEGVTIEFVNNGVVAGTTSSNSEGLYNLNSLIPDSDYDLNFSSNGYLSTKFTAAHTPAEGTVFIESVLQIDTDHAGPGDFTGKISNALTGVGVPSVNIDFRTGLNVNTGNIVATATTDANGNYTVTAADAGHYTGEVTGSGFNRTYFSATNIGNQTNGNQDATITPVLAAGEVRVVLTWGSDPRDLDSHMTGPNSDNSTDRFHLYYANRFLPSVNLDVDDTSSFGPETITITQQFEGTYRYSIHDYTNRNSDASSGLANSSAKVEVYINDTVQTFNVPSSAGTLWTVFELSGTTVTPINQMSYESSPGNVTRNNLHTDGHLIYNLPDKK